MQSEKTINRVDLEIEAHRWGAQDFSTGGRESDCPYTDARLSALWLKSFRFRRENASRFERFIACAARILRIKVLLNK